MAAKSRKPPRGRPFEPGKSGNPGGRPSMEGFRKFLSEVVDKKSGATRRQTVNAALYLKAISSRDKDQMRALELIHAYDMGKPIQAVELTGEGGNPLENSPAGPVMALLERLAGEGPDREPLKAEETTPAPGAAE